MKLKVKSSAPEEPMLELYLENCHDGVKVKVCDGRTNWNLLKITPDGLMLATSIPSHLGFPLGECGKLPVRKETY